jgi:hypothetical protein
MTDSQMSLRIDRNTLRTNQALIVAFTVLAFVVGDEVGRWIVLGTGLVLAVGTIYRPFALFKQVHRRFLMPAGILGAAVEAEDPLPHEFAQAVGALFLLASAAALFGGTTALGWALNWIVTALAFINLTVRFCAGCFVYYQLDRLGLLPASIASTRAQR